MIKLVEILRSFIKILSKIFEIYRKNIEISIILSSTFEIYNEISSEMFKISR